MRIHEVILADSGVSAENLADFLLKSRKHGVDVRLVAGLDEVLARTGRVEEFLGGPVAVFERSSLFGVNAALKRALDFAGAVLGLALSLPAVGLVRVARAAAGSGPSAAQRPDRGWEWVRGLWNILLGRRSFVGPRPGFGPRAEGEGRAVRPGLTGLWATAGRSLWHGEGDLLDSFYVQNWSLGLDLRILLESLRGPRGPSRGGVGTRVEKEEG